jgi:hypothetical protein
MMKSANRKNAGRMYVLIQTLVTLSYIRLWKYASLMGTRKIVADAA